ncbi:rhodanese-like domain-containing protein [Pseudomonas lopnurensis]|uniref:rhodanese-like domain-containing protein n=1 Tax=Pseudomonas lopnurensis TaxID=1477517 RepID=UPI0018794F23|nr:rhodanese-like domain-containing protein [Pseudomonas lopnurensis]MBE7373098.1 sulfurtransferase [Pseudomonas lopnurensis]
MKTAHDLVEQARSHIQEVSLADAEAAIQAADLLIDVREADEYHQGHIASALNIPRGLLEFKLSSTPELGARDLNILLYCKTSGRAALAAASLQEMGYLRVKSIAGGFDAWHEAGLPIVKPSLPSFE